MKDNLEKKETWSTTYRGIPIEIVHWGFDRGKFEPTNNGRGTWNYYIHLHESRIANFAELWKPNELHKWSEASPERLMVKNYYDSPISNVSWHGGITYWEVNNDSFIGHRRMKIGCDYSHLWDQGNEYTEHYLLFDAQQTVDELLDGGIIIPRL